MSENHPILKTESTPNPVAGEVVTNPGEIAKPLGFPEEVIELGDFYRTVADAPRNLADVAELQDTAARIREDDSHYYDTKTGDMLSPTNAARVLKLAKKDWTL